MSDTPNTTQQSAGADAPTDAGAAAGNQFGTFGGVFTPSILTILGVIMFMRTGFVTGEAGIQTAIMILLVSKAITLLTGLSISAISTNTEVKGGGAYFLISRSLGPEFGGAIGLALFMAQALSVPFYILGFVEALVIGFPQLAPWFMAIGMITATAIFIVNYVGAGWAIKAQYGILAILVLSVITLLGGAIAAFDVEIFQQNMTPVYRTPGMNFWAVFAIFFPAVTGIMAGVNMSGDLKDPARSIPKGTLAAIIVGGLIYLLQIILTGGAQTRDMLIDAPYKSLLLQALFGFDWLIMAGVWAATLSSALGSLMGAPRILQALARDNIFPVLAPFALGTVKGDEPRRGLWLSYGLTLAVLFGAGGEAGGAALNAVAAILTMFFLYTYGMTNMAASIESFTNNPSFRPRFRYFHWITGLLGAIGCFGVTFLINAQASIAAAVIIGVIFVIVRRRVLSTNFGDARRGFLYSRVRSSLFKLAEQPRHPKNWRPNMLTLSGNPNRRLTLTQVTTMMAGRHGLVTLAEILVGPIAQTLPRRQETEARLQKFIDDNKLRAFPEVMVAEDLDTGMFSLLQCHSIGPLKPNVIAMGWTASSERARSFSTLLRLARELDISQVLLNDKGLPDDDTPNRRIDIWWRGKRNGSLMLILAYLMTRTWTWSGTPIRVLRILDPDQDPEQARDELRNLTDAGRINAQTKLVNREESVRETIVKHSQDASIVLLGFQPPEDDEAETFFAQYAQILEQLPTTLLVWSNGDTDLTA